MKFFQAACVSAFISSALAGPLHHKHLKREAIESGAVVQVIYDEAVTYVIKKGPDATALETVGTSTSTHIITPSASAVSSSAYISSSSAVFSSSIAYPSSSSVFSSSSYPSSSSAYPSSSSAYPSSSSAYPSSSSAFSSSVYPSASSAFSSSSAVVTSSVYPSSSSVYSPPSAASSSSSVIISSASSSAVAYSAAKYIEPNSVTSVSVAPSPVSTSTSVSTPSTSTSSVSSTTTTASASASASATSTADADTDDFNSSSFQTDILSEHNVKRALHGVPSLVWNSTLAAYAEKMANSYSCPSDGDLTHSGGPYGENLASGFASAIATVDGWYDEIKDYDFATAGTDGFSESTGHFTQVVWKDTTQLGCAYKACDTEYGTYVVCEYYTEGNIIGEDWTVQVPALLS